MNNTQHTPQSAGQGADFQQVKTIEEVLAPLRDRFIAAYIADMKAYRKELVAKKTAIKADENARAFEVYKVAGETHPTIDVKMDAYVSGRVENGTVLPEDVSFDFHRTRTRAGGLSDVEIAEFNKIDADVRDLQKKIDRIPTSETRLSATASIAWMKRLDTLKRGMERKGVDADTARVDFYTVNGGDYDLQISDADGAHCYARSILAGGAGMMVRLHLRFITT